MLLTLQADWLESARSRLLRKADIARRKRVLDLGTGYGVVIPELQRRSSGPVIALDRELAPLKNIAATRICADSRSLPFADQTIDLIFSQNVLLWVKTPEKAAAQARRILQPGGCWILIEPDYGGMMEYPPEIETRELWLNAVERAGGDPMIGRKLPGLLSRVGFSTDVELLPQLLPPSPQRFCFLEDLPLTDQERGKLAAARQAAGQINPSQQVCHLPYYLIVARPVQN